jgi:hypothetical protein
MSVAPVFAPAAMGRPFAFVPQKGAELLKRLPQSAPLSRVVPASRLEVWPAPEMVPSGIREIDELTGGLPRGCLSEVCGPASSGRTSLLLAALSAATRREEVCALVDAGDTFDPLSAAAAGVELGRLLWVRCQANQAFSPQRHRDTEKNFSFASKSRREWEFRLEQVLKTTDLLLQSGGFGLVAIDLSDVPWQTARRIPLTSWFRFRRAVENTPTVLLAVGQEPCARTCVSLLLRLQTSGVRLRESSYQLSAISFQPGASTLQVSELTAQRRKNTAQGASPGSEVGKAQAPKGRRSICDADSFSPEVPPHAQLLGGLRITAEILRSRLERKPAGSITTAFATKTAWSG